MIARIAVGMARQPVFKRAYELKLVPPSDTECDVHDLSGDPRVAEFANHTELPPDPFMGNLSTPVAVH